jgi:hypothetical protein
MWWDINWRMRLILVGLGLVFLAIVTQLDVHGIEVDPQMFEAGLVTCVLVAFLAAGWWWMRSDDQNRED